MGITTIVKNVRLRYHDVYEAREYQTGDGKPRYSATVLIEPGSAQDKQILGAIVEAVKQEFNGDAKKAENFLKSVRGNNNKFFYLEGDVHKQGVDGFEGMWYLAAHRQEKKGPVDVRGPRIDPDTGKLAILTAKTGKPYSGCYVNLKFDIYVQVKENTGVRAGLLALQYVTDGDAFASGAPANADGFDELDSGDTEDGNEFY